MVLSDFGSLDYSDGNNLASVLMVLASGDALRPAAIVARGRTLKWIASLLEVSQLNTVFDVGLFEHRHEALAFLEEHLLGYRPRSG